MTPRFKQLITVRRSIARAELVGLAEDGRVYVWRKIGGWPTWTWMELNNDDAERPIFAASDA